MFSSLARLYPPGSARSVFRVHPVQLSRWLDEVWAAARRTPQIPSRDRDDTVLYRPLAFLDDAVLDALDLPTQPGGQATGPQLSFLAPSGLTRQGRSPFEWNGEPGPAEFVCPPVLWHHLSYAYVIESTGIVEIFAEVLRRLVVGETLAVLTPESVAWARATEQLFFREPPDFSIAGVLSEIRPQERINRRNAYWRMFGMDLPHPIPPHWARSGPHADWKAHTGPVNSDFRQKWNEFLRQVWIGVENRANETGANPADPAYIALLVRALKDMLANRRRGGSLAREELAYVSMLSWFHLTVSSNTSIVVDLQATASSPADRLAAIAQKVGMTSAARARELFDLAEPMSTILRAIEVGLFDTGVSARTLFDPEGSKLATDVVDVINNWQSATGERVKERPAGTVVGPGSAQPLRVPIPAPAGAPSANGQANGQKVT